MKEQRIYLVFPHQPKKSVSVVLKTDKKSMVDAYLDFKNQYLCNTGKDLLLKDFFNMTYYVDGREDDYKFVYERHLTEEEQIKYEKDMEIWHEEFEDYVDNY